VKLRRLNPLEWYVLALAGVVGVGVFGTLACLPFLSVAVWDGQATLAVDLDDRTGGSIVAVWAIPLHGAKDAEAFLRYHGAPDWGLRDVGWVAGQPFTVRVMTSGRTTSWGAELSYSQAGPLALRIDYADGTHRNLTARIPDLRVEKRLKVVVPAVPAS
jgi:hypothetical protein